MKALLLILVPFLCFGQLQDSNFVKGAIYVKIKDNVTIQNANNSSTLNVVGELPFLQALLAGKSITQAVKPFFTPNSQQLQKIYRLNLAQSEAVDGLIKILNQNPVVEYAERIPIDRKVYKPNDYIATGNNSQYNLSIIDAVHAWDVTKGSASILVAVVDDAVQTTHEDLAGNTAQGYDVANNDNDPNPPSTDYSHGTHVAGIVSARTDNGLGVASLGFNTKILPVKASDGTPDGKGGVYITHGYAGVRWAADNGARVINMSWGSYESSSSGRNVINYAASKGCVLVASAGNENTSSLLYPAGYDNVIAVACTDWYDNRSSFSNYGSWVDLAAPGSSIRSTVPFNKYDNYSGTSMASPLVASLAGLMLSVNPTMDRGQLETGLKATADNINTQNPNYVGKLGAGRINAFKAVNWASTVYSTASGSWTGSNWTYQPPSQYTNPVIEADHTITVPAGTYQAKNTVTVNGILDLSSSNSVINVNN